MGGGCSWESGSDMFPSAVVARLLLPRAVQLETVSICIRVLDKVVKGFYCKIAAVNIPLIRVMRSDEVHESRAEF